VEADAPLDRIPLYVRAGSIVPMGPEIEYAGEKPAGPIELRIYPGADGSFDLYADSGNGYGYEKGVHALIPLRWSESSKTLTIGERKGEYPGMPSEIEFKVVWVSPGHGSGPGVVTSPDKVVQYTGTGVSVKQP
jgi:alpha-D-xyloside xylohydrolase